jgi:hypothetical protein
MPFLSSSMACAGWNTEDMIPLEWLCFSLGVSMSEKLLDALPIWLRRSKKIPFRVKSASAIPGGLPMAR